MIFILVKSMSSGCLWKIRKKPSSFLHTHVFQSFSQPQESDVVLLGYLVKDCRLAHSAYKILIHGCFSLAK